MRVDMKLTGAEGVLELLQKLPAEVVSKRGGPVKLALAKGARLLRDEVKQNLRASIARTGDPDGTTGLLEQNIIASRGKEPASGRGECYLVRVKRKSYPDRQGRPVTTLKTAHIKEYGSVKQEADPFIRPAVISKGAQVIRVVTDDLNRRLDLAVKKLAKSGRTVSDPRVR